MGATLKMKECDIMRILVVEDDRLLNHTLCYNLNTAGYAVDSALTKSAAKELAPKKIRVNSIAPGLTQTAMMQQADIEKLQGRINNICMGRLAQPRDIAGGCLLLACDYSAYISGQILPVDGCTIM